MDRVKEILIKHGMAPAAASQAAVGEAYQIMLRQASMLSYKNAFTVLGCVVMLLSPLPFLMRLPPKRPAKPAAPGAPAAPAAGESAPAEPAPEELAVH